MTANSENFASVRIANVQTGIAIITQSDESDYLSQDLMRQWLIKRKLCINAGLAIMKPTEVKLGTCDKLIGEPKGRLHFAGDPHERMEGICVNWVPISSPVEESTAKTDSLRKFVEDSYKATICVCKLNEVCGTGVECTHCRAGELLGGKS